MKVDQAKERLDSLIADSRYKSFRPIRTAEILYHSRQENVKINDLESNETRKWRDNITERLIGSKCKSSANYQEYFWELMPVEALEILDKKNREGDGIIESYIYRTLKKKNWSSLIEAKKYIQDTEIQEFSFNELMDFAAENELQSDSLYEIIVYALFAAIVDELDAKAELRLSDPDEDILSDFSDFNKIFLGLTEGTTAYVTPVSIHRASEETYASDKGIDIGTNFGTMVQVKYVSLDEDKTKKISKSAFVDQMVVVCKEAEADLIETVANQLGYDRLRAVVTFSDLDEWYELAIKKYPQRIGLKLLSYLREEITHSEFSVPRIDDFLVERGYDKLDLGGVWSLS